MLSTFNIDTLQIHGGSQSSYILTDVTGLDAPDIRLSSYENPGEDGLTVSTQRYGGRLLTLPGVVQGSDVATYLAARRALSYACRVRHDSFGLVSGIPLTFTTLDGASYSVTGYIKPPLRMSGPHPTWAPFQISFLCPDPAIYGTTLLTTGQVSVATGGGFTFPATFPITFTTGTGGSGTLNNTGTMDTWPLIYLRGAMQNPRIYSVQRGAALKLNYTTTNASDLIVINMRNKTIMLNGSVNLLQYRDSADRAWFSLPPDVNTILFGTTSSGDTGTMEATAYPAYQSI
ncbi:phage-related protein [Pseudarthrobacter sp. W1I19]|uniref:phage distal tail protein n=1 Tax=Pseudarthrobacter sp. W1I19 TaxID=3042288 RepID=UPI002780A311|nr:phage tail domain-containing protein [Pseudarthrobacter sp. W1I19]MDQ0923347.1 phage-related protein [Pseudarthrobacter sp. W1I19]